MTTIVEKVAYDAGTFFKRVYTDVHGNEKPLLHSIVAELHNLQDTRAPFPPGTPATISLADSATIALLADWGGDNDAAKHVADIVRKHNLDIGIHLGDIYYGGIREECETFLRLWPFNIDTTGGRHSSSRDRTQGGAGIADSSSNASPAVVCDGCGRCAVGHPSAGP